MVAVACSLAYQLARHFDEYRQHVLALAPGEIEKVQVDTDAAVHECVASHTTVNWSSTANFRPPLHHDIRASTEQTRFTFLLTMLGTDMPRLRTGLT